MLHILLGHRYGWTRGFPNVNSNVFANGGEWTKTVFSALIAVQPIAVDSFFVMGGLLLARSILHNIEKFVTRIFLVKIPTKLIEKYFHRKKFNIPKMYLHRYLRVTPVLAVLVLIIVSILKFLGDGPHWDFVSNAALIGQCDKNWWAALLHIQNYYDPLQAVILLLRKAFIFLKSRSIQKLFIIQLIIILIYLLWFRNVFPTK